MKKKLALILSVVMVFGVTVGATLAWLTDTTDSVTNTFTVGNINIDLDETDNTDTDGDNTPDAWFGKMVPGATLDKDPVVTVAANSEAHWLFVKVTESDNLDTFISYTIDSENWTAVPDVENVYYREQAATTASVALNVLAEKQVTVKTDVTKTLLDGITDATRPTLTFQAYAIQKEAATDVNKAWDLAVSEFSID